MGGALPMKTYALTISMFCAMLAIAQIGNILERIDLKPPNPMSLLAHKIMLGVWVFFAVWGAMVSFQ